MKKTLEIIMPHYNEPWEDGEKFFDMLDLQRGVDFSQIKVTIVNDGEEYRLPDKYFRHRPYAVKQICIEHGGVSAARNAGIRQSDAKWICFCDFDDMFSNVYALRDVMNVLDTEDYDLLWGDFYAEDKLKDGSMRLHVRGENLVFIHAKFYRRSFLIDNDLWFDTALSFNEDSAFNSVLNTILDYHRMGKIETLTPIYVWSFRENSSTTLPGNRNKALIGLFERNKRVCEAFKERMPYDRYCAMVARTIMDGYYSLNMPEVPEELQEMKEDFVRFYLEHKADYQAVPYQT